MHIISNERALAHWRSLCGLPASAMNGLKDRFIREQPALAATLLVFLGGTTGDPDDVPQLRPKADPSRADFERLVECVAMLAELMQREAGRPLCRLETAEIRELTETNLALFK